MLSLEIRKEVLDYFKKRGHIIVPSCPVVPPGDPTLLFTNAGMVQFKRVFLGEERRSYKRAVSCQKCVRAGGKHSDLENVGKTIRHHSFFEMLGNFSFGDYFKEEAISYAWELLTKEFALPKERLWISIFKDDDEAYKIWHKKIGIASERIVRMEKKDNFWSMGETGPCGPCSEIIYDLGEAFSCGRPQCRVGCDCDRYLEIWNLVFMQYNREQGGKLSPLPNPCIDTGMGLERIAMVLQGVGSDYETDLFRPLLDAVSDISNIPYGQSRKRDIAFHVIADHSRTISFIMADGILPSNEGRGYVLRRILRRAGRYGHMLNLKQPFLYRLTDVVIDLMGGVYPELKEAKQLIIEITKKEEERFLETLGFGLKLLNEEIKKLKQKDIDFISGASTFKLYDTYGFPIDIISDVAKEENLKVDVAGFEKIMSLQKSRAREAQKATSSVLSGINIYTRLSYQGEKTRFLGYDTLKVKSKITHLIKKAKETETIKAQEEGELITKETPFYGESGGQVGDSGFITSTKGIAKVKDTQIVGTLFIHLITVTKGQLSRGDEVELRVNRGRRSAITSNHTATHLLQAALRKTLGTHVKQAGSLVAPERIRFDFTHFGSLTSKVLEKIELLVNNAIRENLPVESKQMPLVEAIKSGAIAIFEEKYSDIVRVIFIPKWSKELCGGTHVRRTGDIGYFKIISESSIAAGVRRIEAVTAEAAITYIQKKEHLLEELSHILKVKPIDILAKVKRILKELREREKEISTLKTALAIKQTQQLLRTIRYINGIAVIASEISSVDAKTLREMGDRLRGKLKSGVVVLGSCSNGKVILVAMVSKDLTSHIRAKDIIKKVAPLIGGEGGGRPDMAQAGGRYPQNLAQALEAVYKTISSLKT